MAGNDRIAQVVCEWVEKAENDLKNAAHTIKMGEDCPTDTVCFHAQQCVEKYLKAFLVSKCAVCPTVPLCYCATVLLSRNFSAFRGIIGVLG